MTGKALYPTQPLVLDKDNREGEKILGSCFEPVFH